MLNTWEFQRNDERIRIYRSGASTGPTIVLETPMHQATLEFPSLLELHDFHSAFEHHLVTSGWSLVGFSRRKLSARNPDETSENETMPRPDATKPLQARFKKLRHD